MLSGRRLIASVGSGIGHILEDFDPDNPPDFASIILEPQYILPIIGLVLLATLPLVYKRFRRGKGSNAS